MLQVGGRAPTSFGSRRVSRSVHSEMLLSVCLMIRAEDKVQDVACGDRER